MSRVYLLSVGLMLATATSWAACPITECNYSDPQYQIASGAWSDCALQSIDRWKKGIEILAISYPKFGIAWSAQKNDMDLVGTDQNANAEAHRRFEDRILNTAEPEALQYYNLFRLKFDQQFKQCGQIPEPPRGQPQ